MTFLAPAHTAETRIPAFLSGRKPARLRVGLRIGDEDGARRALGSDHGLPTAVLNGTAIEHLARIALG